MDAKQAVQQAVAQARADAGKFRGIIGHDDLLQGIAARALRLKLPTDVDYSSLLLANLELTETEQAALDEEDAELLAVRDESANEPADVYGGVSPGTALAKAHVLSLDLPEGHSLLRLANLMRASNMPTLASAEAETDYVIATTRVILHSKSVTYGMATAADRRLSDSMEDEIETDDADHHAFLTNNANGITSVLSAVSQAINQMNLTYNSREALMDFSLTFLDIIKTYKTKAEALASPEFRRLNPALQDALGEFWYGREKLEQLLQRISDEAEDDNFSDTFSSAEEQASSPLRKIPRVTLDLGDDEASVSSEGVVVDDRHAEVSRGAEDSWQRRRASGTTKGYYVTAREPIMEQQVDNNDAFFDSRSGEESSDEEEELAAGGYFESW